MGWGVGKVVGDQVIAFQRYTEDWTMLGWGGIAVGLVIFALAGVAALNKISS